MTKGVALTIVGIARPEFIGIRTDSVADLCGCRLSYTVARRSQEMGVRMALGARPGDVTRMVIGDGSRVGLAGIAIGVVAAMLLGRLVTTLLAGVTGSDPATLVAVGVLLVVMKIETSGFLISDT